MITSKVLVTSPATVTVRLIVVAVAIILAAILRIMISHNYQ